MLVGNSKITFQIKNKIKSTGPLRLLLLGETGVGKTPFAKYSNQCLSQEGYRPFEQVNCAAFSLETFQDKLFGHVKGAYTGAHNDKKGLVELAEGGDLFLDEIGDLSLECQALLLTFLDNQEYYRLGCDKKRKAHVRIISATNRNLMEMIDKGTFRKDLYSRISQVTIFIPPLRARKEEIEIFIEYFIETFEGSPKSTTKEFITTLLSFNYTHGNVRELKDMIEYACMMAKNSTHLDISHLPEKQASIYSDEIKSLQDSIQFIASIAINQGLNETLQKIEHKIIEYHYEKHRNVDKLGPILRISKASLYRRIRQYRIA